MRALRMIVSRRVGAPTTGTHMPGRRLRAASFAFAMALALGACASHAPATPQPARPAAKLVQLTKLPPKQWPLKFRRHRFSAFCYSTYGCTVHYAGMQQCADAPDVLQPSSASYGPDYRRNWSGMHGMIDNFPPPADVDWRSADGQAHHATIDIGALFQDQVVRHNVSREEMADLVDGEYRGEPSIILEVNDRTIRVYMREMIFLKKLVMIGKHERNDHRYESILVHTSTY